MFKNKNMKIILLKPVKGNFFSESIAEITKSKYSHGAMLFEQKESRFVPTYGGYIWLEKGLYVIEAEYPKVIFTRYDIWVIKNKDREYVIGKEIKEIINPFKFVGRPYQLLSFITRPLFRFFKWLNFDKTANFVLKIDIFKTVMCFETIGKCIGLPEPQTLTGNELEKYL